MRISTLIPLLLILAAICSASSGAEENATSLAQSYTVLVGGNDSANNAELQSFFPRNLTIHVGDTVTWKQNTNDIHTVTFTPGMTAYPEFVLPAPDGNASLMVNPLIASAARPADGWYNGSTYANSGVMGPDEQQPKSFNLTFTEAGTYEYVCIVHGGENMTGTVMVKEANATVPSPVHASAEGQRELEALRSLAEEVHAAALASVQKPERNADNTTTHHILVGYGHGKVHLEAFFPDRLTVHPGDTVVWTLPEEDMEPHTITFLNGAKEPEIFLAQAQPQGPPRLILNPEILLPSRENESLTNQGVYNSGFIDPEMPGPHTFRLLIGDVSGDLEYICILHDESNMKGILTISPQQATLNTSILSLKSG